MKRTLLASTLAAWALFQPAPTHAADRAAINRRTGLFELPASDLRKAAERGDRAELARAAGRLGPARLAKALADPDRRTVLAALEGVSLVPSGILLLDPIAPLCSSTDRAIREYAIRALSALLATNDAERLAEWEVPAESTRAACQALAATAADEKGESALRLSALQGLADSGATCAPGFDPTKILSSRDPELRRAAVLALPASPETNNALLAAAKDGDVRVAAAAGARLCARQAKDRALKTHPPLSQLALAEGAAVEDVIEMLPCLASSKDPADGKALETLRESGPPAVRDAVKGLVSAGKSAN
jgi:hypothetical protein